MLQRYKLRLGDGTVLLVDLDGLGTWMVDKKATVQAGRSGNWIPLRKFLLLAKAAQARRDREARDAAASRSSPDTPRRADGLPLVPPPPRRDGASTSEPTPPPRADGLPLVQPPPPESPSTPEPAQTPPPLLADGPPPAPPAVADNTPAPSPLAGASDDEVSLVIPRAQEEEIAGPSLGPPPEIPVSAGSDGVQPPSVPEPVTPAPPPAFVAPAEPHAVAMAAEEEPICVVPPGTGDEEETTVDLSTLGPGPAVAEPAPAADADPPPVVVPDEVEEAVKVTVGPARVMQARIEEPAPIATPPLGATEPAPAMAWSAPAPADAPAWVPPADPPALETSPGDPRGIRALADEGAPVEDVTDLPVVPLKALPQEDQVAGDVWTGAPRDAARRGPPEAPRPAIPLRLPRLNVPNPLAGLGLSEKLGEDFWKRGKAASVQQGLASAGAFISRCLSPINRLERGQSLFLHDGPHRPRTPDPGPASRVEATPRPPAMPVEPLAEEPRLAPVPDVRHPALPLETADDPVDRTPSGNGPSLLDRTRGWLEKPRAWAAGLRRERREDASRPGEPSPRPVVAGWTPWRTERLGVTLEEEVSAPPPSFEELPVLPLATPVEPAVTEDTYGFDGGAIAGTVWLWTKRLLVTGALAAGGAWAFMNFEIWSPPAAEIGQTTLTGIDGHVRTLDLIRQRHEAVAAVEGELPHLSPDTIRRLMAVSPIGLLDPKGVFEAAWVAAERGAPLLPAEDARELEAVQKELLDGLFETELEWLREYDKARFRRAVFPFDAQQAHEVYARGVRRLPQESQETLRARLNQAIALGMVPAESERDTAD